jgi:RHS repeat-associated protein
MHTVIGAVDQRYYSSIMGRFLTPDRLRKSARLRRPQSWNRYAYVINDPVNRTDPRGPRDGDDTDDEDPDDTGGDDQTVYPSDTVFVDDVNLIEDEVVDFDDGGFDSGIDRGGTPISEKDRTRNTVWMGNALTALKTFTTKKARLFG